MTVSETLTALKTKKGIVPSADYSGTEKAELILYLISQLSISVCSCLNIK